MLQVQFQATFYELQTDSDHIGTLDAQALARQAETAESLLKVLSEKGQARILYRIDQPANVYSDKIVVSTKEPVITGSRLTTTGQKIDRITYRNVGVVTSLSVVNPGAADSNSERLDVKLGIELATLVKGKEGQEPTQPSIRNVTVDHSEPLEFDRPMAMMLVSSASSGEETMPVAYVIRYLFKQLDRK